MKIIYLISFFLLSQCGFSEQYHPYLLDFVIPGSSFTYSTNKSLGVNISCSYVKDKREWLIFMPVISSELGTYIDRNKNTKIRGLLTGGIGLYYICRLEVGASTNKAFLIRLKGDIPLSFDDKKNKYDPHLSFGLDGEFGASSCMYISAGVSFPIDIERREKK